MTDAPLELFRRPWGHRGVRIPAVAAIDAETLVAMAVRRRFITDWGPSDLLVRRSTDGGATWWPHRVLMRGWGRTVDNPTLVVDRAGILHLLYQVGYRRLLHRRSTDGGVTFSRPADLTSVVTAVPERDGFVPRVLAPGPGTGALLTSGRLVVPVWVSSSRTRRHSPSATLTITSDDGGMSWNAGDYAAFPGRTIRNPSEAAVAALPDGGGVMSVRQRTRRRAFTRSADGATGWEPIRFAAEIFEPGSHAGLATAGDRVAFVNPDSRELPLPDRPDGKATRANLTLRVSADAGETWGDPRVIDAGPSGYAAITITADDILHVVYERGSLSHAPLWPTAIAYRRIRL